MDDNMETIEDLSLGNPFSAELMKRTAASKGFGSVFEHKYHLMRKYPDFWCGYVYNQYARLANCEGNDSSRCAKLRSVLVAECKGVDTGDYRVSFPDVSHLENKRLSLEQALTILSALHGLSKAEFLLFAQRQRELANPFPKLSELENPFPKLFELAKPFISKWF